MKRCIVLAFLLFCAATAYAQVVEQTDEVYGSKVSFTYAPMNPDDFLGGAKTYGTLVDPSQGPRKIYSPVWSLDGNSIAFTDGMYIFLVPAEGGEAEVKFASYYLYPYKDTNLIFYNEIWRLVGFSPDGSTLYFIQNRKEEGAVITVTETSNGLSTSSSGDLSNPALVSLDIYTGEVQIMYRDVDEAALSRSGKYFMYYTRDSIHVKDFEAGEEWNVETPVYVENVTFSADEKSIIYTGDGGGTGYGAQIFRMPIEGGASVQLTSYSGGEFGAYRLSPLCCPDSEWIIYKDWGTITYSNEIKEPGNRSSSYTLPITKLCALNADTREIIDIFSGSPGILLWMGQFSPDGEKMCYSLEDHNKVIEQSGLYIKEISLPAAEQNGQLSVADAAPQGFALTGNYPNPFNPSTRIAFIIPSSGSAQLSVYDVTGRKVRDLISSTLSAGAHEMIWDGKDESGATVSSGTYIARLKMGNLTSSHRMLLVK